MGMVTISAKIPKELHERLKKHRLRVSEIVRRALEKEVRAHERKLLLDNLGKVSTKIRGKMSAAEITRIIRTSREER